MARPFRQQIDDRILDRAAALFAQRGFAKTSVQDIAASVGLSKAGLLHHFSTKDALFDAVLGHADRLGQQVLDQVEDLPLGEERDRQVVESIAELALAHPGVIALMLAEVNDLFVEEQDGASRTPAAGPGNFAFGAFGVDPDAVDQERLVQVVGATAALAVLALAARRVGQASVWRRHIISTTMRALGH